MAPLHERIREARERLQLTQPQVAREVGVSPKTVGNWERGETVPRNRLGRLEEVLGVALRGQPTGPRDDQESLPELAARRMRELGMVNGGELNVRELWRRGGGGQPGRWAYENVRAIVRGFRATIEDDTAETLAHALEVPVADVHAALGQRVRGRPFELPDYAAGLTANERRLIVGIVDAILGYPEDRPEVPAQRRSRRAGVPVLDTAQLEGLRLAEPGSRDLQGADDDADGQ